MYDERLGVPLRWWALATMFLATVLLAFLVATARPGSRWTGTASLLAAAGRACWSATARPGSTVARRRAAAPAGPGSPSSTSARPRRSTPTPPAGVAGRDADARAFLLLRPYLKRAVRVDDRRPGRPDAVLAGLHPPPRRLAAALRTRRAPGRPRPGTGSHDDDGTLVGTYEGDTDGSGSKVWTVFWLAATWAPTAVATKALTATWKLATGKKPPSDPARPRRAMARGGRLGRRQRHRRGRWPGCSRTPPGGRLLRDVDRAPAGEPGGRRRSGRRHREND